MSEKKRRKMESALEKASVGRLEFELLRRAIARTIETIKTTEEALAHLRDRKERQMRELAVQFTRLDGAETEG